MRRLIGWALGAFIAAMGGSADQPAVDVGAAIETSLKTDAAHIRQLAFDGDSETFFASEGEPNRVDHFTLVFYAPVALKSIEVITGRPDGRDALDSGVLEVSEDGETFEAAARFRDGRARTAFVGGRIHAVRVRPDGDLGHPLAIREFVTDSDPKLSRFEYPVEFTVDVSSAPDMQEWAEMVARECERQYLMINQALKSEEYKPPQRISLRLDAKYDGVAYASGDRITGSSKFFTAHPDDVGAMIHETCHVVQRYRRRGANPNPGWLVEGVADHVRFFRYEPSKIGTINARRARYNSSYRVTAAFLNYVSEKYERDLVLKLNRLMRDGNYRDDAFKDLTGKTVEELDDEWRATLAK
jgi:Peptidase of plants and bacteria